MQPVRSSLLSKILLTSARITMRNVKSPLFDETPFFPSSPLRLQRLSLKITTTPPTLSVESYVNMCIDFKEPGPHVNARLLDND